MTLDRMSVLRHQPVDWPLFAGMDLPDDVGVLFVENRRRAGEEMGSAVGAASEVLRAGLAHTGDRVTLWLLAVGRPFPAPETPLRRRMLDRSPGFWAGVETDGTRPVTLPRGERSEVRVSWAGDVLGFAGSIRFGLDDLPAALGVVREAYAQYAVVVATDPAAADPLPMLLPPSPPPDPSARFPLYTWAVARVVDGTFPYAVRATGSFDDHEVGPDVVARTPLLDPLEAALRQVLAGADVEDDEHPEDAPPRGPHPTTGDGRRDDH